MKRTSRLAITLAFSVLLLFLASNAAPSLPMAPTSFRVRNANDTHILSDGSAPWWDSSFTYRRFINFTEPDVSDRNLAPVHLLLAFENGRCYTNSIRIMYFQDPQWVAIPFQLWNTTFYSGGQFIESTRVSFMVNATRAVSETNFYVYYAKTDIGSVSYPNFHPFIYKSTTFSLINLVSYYDDNNYVVEMWDPTLDVWDDPRIVDARWGAGGVSPTNVPSGTLDKYESIRYEPTATDYSNFWGFYAVYSNYPLSVTMGTGDMNLNPGVSDWYPSVDEMGDGVSTRFILGGVEGYEDGNEGKYWVQAQMADTEVYVWTVAETPDSGWKFFNDSDVLSWPAILDAGEYIFKRDVIYTTYMLVNSTKPVSVRSGDSDVTYARDCGGYFSSITGKLVGEEFYSIDMGQRKDNTRVTNTGPTAVTVEWWRNDGTGWVKGTDLNIAANGSAYISRGSSSATDPDDILHIKGPPGSQLFVEGVYDPPKIKDYGDWAPTLTGMRFGTNYRIWGGSGMKFTVIAWENAHVDIMGWNNAQLDIPAGAVDVFMPLSNQHSLYNIVSNASISIVSAGVFDTGTEEPSGDQGYGWMVPAYSSQGDEAGLLIAIGTESIQATIEISVVDLDSQPVEDATVTLYNTDNSIWLDGNGFNRSGTTDATGQIVFENLANQTYRIRTSIDAASWLSTSFTNIWVKNTTDQSLTGKITSVEITLQLADIDVHLEDIMSKSMNDAIDEDTWLGLHNGTGPNGDYIAQGLTNDTGWVHFDSVPRDSYESYISYAGGEGWSYDFEHLDDFGTWTVDSSDFDSGSIVFSNWVVPLISLNIHVTSWDDLDVQGATVKIDNAVNPALYTITRTSNITGDFTFRRIVNGTWSVDVSKEDSYATTPIARNNTVTLSNLQSLTSQTIEIPLSRLVVRVYTDLGAWVENAQVNVSMSGFGLVAQGVTDSLGYVAFFNIHANLSSPYSVSYNVTVQYGTELNGTVIEILLKCDYDWTYVNMVYVGTPIFGGAYTELSASDYFINLRWGRDASFVVDYYKRNETGTFPIPYDGTTWLNFTIYDGVSTIGHGSWNISGFEWVINTTTIGFTITIDSDYWMMGVVEAAYTVVIQASTNGYEDPTQITVYINMLLALTSEGVETPAIVEYYETHSPHDFWMYDSTNNANVSGLAVHTYLVKNGLVTVASGTLIDNLDGTYTFPASALSGLEVGSYVITLSLKKLNYENLTIVVGATINALPMTLEMYTPSDYDWSLGSESIEFNYTIALNGSATDLQDVTVQIEWINHGTGLVYSTDSISLDAIGSIFTYSFSANIVPSGEWRVRITAAKSNYQSAASTYSVLTVSPAPTLLVVNPITTNVAWTEIAVVQVTFTRISDGAGLSGALITHNWIAPIIIDYEGLGVYTLYIDTTIPAQVYMLELNASLSNHEIDSVSTSITIRIPLKIENGFASDETPLVAYWTRTFDIIVRLLDNSRFNTTIEDGTITYYWSIPGGTDQSGPLTNLGGGLYGITLDSDDANILVSDYQISLDATRAGATSASSTVFLLLEDVPNEVILEDIIYLPYYGDVVTISFYWNNTLDNQPVINPVSASFYVEPLGLEIGSYVNYGNGTYTFNVDTRNLGMHEYLYDAFYTVNIVMSANGLEVHPATFTYFLIRETPTRMDVATQYTAEWSENITVTADIFDTFHNEYVSIGATATLVYGVYAIPMTSFGNGTFYAAFNTTTYFASSATPYDLEIIYSIPDYVDGSVDIEVLISPLTADIVIQTLALQDGYHQLDWAETFAIEFALELSSRPGANVPEGLAQYSWLDFPSVNGVFSFNPLNYRYSTNIDAGLVIAGLRTLRVFVQLSNHTIAPFDLIVNVTHLVAVLSTESTRIEVFYGTDNLDISLSLTYNDNNLEADRVFTTWAGITRGGDWDGEKYVFQFNPSYSDLEVPSTLLLNFTAELDNYTVTTLQIPLLMLARTQLAGESVTLEAGDSVVVYFRYWDVRNDRNVPGATVRAILPGSLEEISPESNGTHYYFTLNPTNLEIRPEAYNIILTAFAYGYQNYTSTTGGDVASLDLFVREPTYNIPFLGPQPRTLVHGALLLLGLIGIVSASSVAVRRARIPYHIKQINKAIKQIEGGKTAEVVGIKSLETVVSEMLSAGLAELDIAPPTVEFIPDEVLEDLFDEETLVLLSQVDALRALDEPEEVQAEPEVPTEIEEVDVPTEEVAPKEAVPEPEAIEEVEPVSEPEEVVEPEPRPDLRPEPESAPEPEEEPIEEMEEELPPEEEAPKTDELQVEEAIEPKEEIPSIEVVPEVDEFLDEGPPESEAEPPPEEATPPAIEEAPVDDGASDFDELEELDALDEPFPMDEPTEIPIDEVIPKIVEPEAPEEDLIEVDVTPEPEDDAEVDEWEPVIEELRERLTPEIKSSYTKEELDAMSDDELEALIKALEKAEVEKENGEGS